MNTIILLNELLLPPFLFMVYFSLGAMLIYMMRPQNKTTQPDMSLADYAAAFAEEFDPDPISTDLPEQEPPLSAEDDSAPDTAITNAPSPPSQEKTALSESPIKLSLTDLLTDFIKTLKQAQLRKLCYPLGIQQKRNGVWLSTDLMRGEIQRHLKQNPEKVWQVCQERIPTFVPDELQESLA